MDVVTRVSGDSSRFWMGGWLVWREAIGWGWLGAVAIVLVSGCALSAADPEDTLEKSGGCRNDFTASLAGESASRRCQGSDSLWGRLNMSPTPVGDAGPGGEMHILIVGMDAGGGAARVGLSDLVVLMSIGLRGSHPRISLMGLGRDLTPRQGLSQSDAAECAGVRRYSELLPTAGWTGFVRCTQAMLNARLQAQPEVARALRPQNAAGPIRIHGVLALDFKQASPLLKRAADRVLSWRTAWSAALHPLASASLLGNMGPIVEATRAITGDLSQGGFGNPACTVDRIRIRGPLPRGHRAEGTFQGCLSQGAGPGAALRGALGNTLNQCGNSHCRGMRLLHFFDTVLGFAGAILAAEGDYGDVWAPGDARNIGKRRPRSLVLGIVESIIDDIPFRTFDGKTVRWQWVQQEGRRRGQHAFLAAARRNGRRGAVGLVMWGPPATGGGFSYRLLRHHADPLRRASWEHPRGQAQGTQDDTAFEGLPGRSRGGDPRSTYLFHTPSVGGLEDQVFFPPNVR